MKTLLQLNTSLFSENGQSSRMVDQFVSKWRAANPQGHVVSRDLATTPVPHLTAERFTALTAKPDERNMEQQAVADFSDVLLDELRNADVIALGLPMYNFGIPSTLKAYFDHIARAGMTFRYTDKGPVGMLTGKKAYVFAARGGMYAGTATDTQTPYVRDFLRFIGIEEVEFVYAEGLAMGDQQKQTALVSAEKAIRQLVEPLQNAA